MRRPVTRGSNISTLLAAMKNAMGKDTKVKATAKKDKASVDKFGREYWSWLRPAAANNQHKLRKKWRMAPHTRPKSNTR